MSIKFPKWFKYKHEDFTKKNSEVWNFIKRIKKFSRIVALYQCCIDDEEIASSLQEIIGENLCKYESDEIKSYLSLNRFYLNCFNNKFKNFLQHCKKRIDLIEHIESDICKLQQIEESLISLKKLYEEIGCKKDCGISDELKEIKEFEDAGKTWIKEKRIVGGCEWSDWEINKAMSLYPKTFKFVLENKLGWDLGGWSGGY